MMSNDTSNFNLDMDYVKSCLITSGLSHKAIAMSQNMSESTVSRFFSGAMKTYDIYTVAKIMNAIGASMDRACGIVKPVEEAVTEPTPDLAATVINVLDSMPPIVDADNIAAKVADSVKEATPAQVEINIEEIAKAVAAQIADTLKSAAPGQSSISNVSEIAKAVVDALPTAPAKECSDCRAAQVYESALKFRTNVIVALGGAVGVLMVFLMVLLLWK